MSTLSRYRKPATTTQHQPTLLKRAQTKSRKRNDVIIIIPGTVLNLFSGALYTHFILYLHKLFSKQDVT